MTFAKLYETELGQIVVLNDQKDEGDPAIVFMFDPKVDGLGVCQVAMAFENKQTMNSAFSEVTEGAAKKLVSSQLDSIRGLFGDEA